MIAGMLLLFVAPTVTAQVAEPEKEKPITRSYLVADLLKKETQLGWTSADKSRRAPIEELVYLLQTTTGAKHWRGTKAEARLEIVQGDTLEITAAPKLHGTIKDLLDALRRLADISVRIDSELYEVERDFFTRQIEPGLDGDKKARVPFTMLRLHEDAAKTLRKQKVSLRATKDLGNGGRGCYFSLHRSVLFVAQPSWARKDEVHETALHGMSFHTQAVVSADRRRVTLKLESQHRELIEIVKETVTNPLSNKEETIERPEIVETRRLATLQVDDGDWLLALLPSTRKDQLRLLLIQPTIRIPEEERAHKVNP